jgi:hypothetical protein
VSGGGAQGQQVVEGHMPQMSKRGGPLGLVRLCPATSVELLKLLGVMSVPPVQRVRRGNRGAPLVELRPRSTYSP